MAKPTVVTIDAISDPILAKAEIPEPMGEVLRTLAAKVAAGSNWKVRKKALIDVVEGLDAMMAIGEAEAAFVDDPDADPPLDDPAPDDPAPDDLGPDDPAEDAGTVDGDLDVPEFDVVDVLPAYVGAILEVLGETRVSSVEQAACYILSAHPEHQKAGWDWIDADYGNWRAFNKLLRADRRYAFYYDEIEALATADADAAGEGEADPGGAEPRA
jgi:hypothetical protein